MKIGLRYCEVQEIGGQISEKYIQGKWKLVHEIGRFEKLRVQEIGIPLLFNFYSIISRFKS